MTATNEPLQKNAISSQKRGLEAKPLIRIRPTGGWTSLKLKEVWDHRELIGIFVWRDIKVRYRQTVIGALWAIVQPFLTMVIFSVFFGRLAGMPSDGVDYPIFAYAGLVPWTFFANSLNQASNSLVNNAEMIKKIYFPRLTLPIASVLGGLVDFILAFIILVLMMLYYGFVPTVNILWFPFFVLLAMIAALGVSLWLAAMNVQFRDVRYMVPFIIQAWMFATPVVYPSSLLMEPWRTLYGLNPMVGVVEGFRWALLGTGSGPGPMVFLSFCVALVILVSGVYYFRRVEKIFADVI